MLQENERRMSEENLKKYATELEIEKIVWGGAYLCHCSGRLYVLEIWFIK